MQSPDHADRQATLAIEHLGNTRTRSDQRLKVLARQSLLRHPEFDRFDRVGRINGKMRRLVSVDQGCEHVETIARRGTQPGAPQALDLAQRGLVVLLRANGLDVIFHAARRNAKEPKTEKPAGACARGSRSHSDCPNARLSRGVSIGLRITVLRFLLKAVNMAIDI